MADLKLVGAVAIKVRPDASGFRKSTEQQVKKALAGVDADVEVDARVDTTEMGTDVEKAKKEIEAKIINLKVGVDYDSILRAQKQLERAIKDHEAVTISVNLDDPNDVEAKLAQLANDLDNSQVEITYVQDEKGYREVLAKIAEIRRQKLVETIQFDIDEDGPNGLRAKEAEIKALLGEATVAPITFEYDMNPAGLAEARAKLRALLGISDPKIVINAGLDASQLRAELAAVDFLLDKEEAKKRKIKFEADMASYIRTLVAIAFLTRDQRVTIAVHLRDNAFLAAAKLVGLRAAARWTEEFARAIGTLDRNLPIVAAATLALSALSAGTITLVADMFSLGNGLGEVIRMGALLAPAMITGLGAIMTVFTGVFKDFGAAVNGDTKAIEKLSESGKKAAAGIRVHFQAIRETISANFWDKASENMLNFTETALPQVKDGLGKLASSMGVAFGTVLDSFTRLAQNDGIKVFFANLSRGFDIAGPGISNFFDAFNKLAVVGSTVFPRLGKAFNDMSSKFISWVDKVASDGSLQRWIDQGVEGMKQLFGAGVSLVKVWGNIGQAATAAGALTLGSFEAMLHRLDTVTAGARFQQNMKTIFKGARDASDAFHKSLGDLGPAMDVFSKTIATTLTGSGKALGAFIRDIGDVMSSPRLSQGIVAFTDGLTNMFVSLRPAAGAIADMIGTIGEILGQVATDSGPLFRDLFVNLAGVLDTAWAALEPFLPGLIEIGQTVINTLGPAFSELASVIVPAFARGLIDIGDGLQPVIQFLADFAVSAARVVASMPIADVIGIATAILTLGTSMQIAATTVPILVAALNTFRTTAAITATTTALLIPGFGLLLAALTGFTAFAVTSFATAQENATPKAAEYAAALEEDAKAAGKLGDELGKATTKVALHDLATSGAYENAEKLGISHQLLTEAAIKGGPALEKIRDIIGGSKKDYDEATAAAHLLALSGQEITESNGQVSQSTIERRDAAEKLDKLLNQSLGTIDQETKKQELWNKIQKDAGILTEEHTEAQKDLAFEIDKTSKSFGIAAAASATLQDEFAGTAAKVDAMRKTFSLLLGPDTQQQAADSAGAYVKAFADITEAAAAVRPEIEKLGEAAYGQNGFLNTASGNSAILQVNQALIDQVNNTWAAAKVIYDNTLRETGNAQHAFQRAKEFIDSHKVDFDQLAANSGLNAAQVNGQWEAVFGHDWVLKVSLAGATEAAVAAEAMVLALKGQWDGQKFMAEFDADPTLALLAIKDPIAAAEYWVNKNWQTKLDALPDPAQEALRKLIGQTEAEWDKGDFEAILQVAQKIPGLAEALIQINNGVDIPRYAQIFAQLNSGMYDTAMAALDWLANKPRYATVGVTYVDLNRDAAMANRMGAGAANGAIMDGYGRGMKGFNPRYFANGGFNFENHVAQIAKPGIVPRVWAEAETHGEAYIPYAMSKRPRSVAILSQVAKDFGYQLTKASQEFANGGISTTTGATTHTSADVHIGSIHTVDMNEAVAKLRQSQRDALAVAGISTIGG